MFKNPEVQDLVEKRYKEMKTAGTQQAPADIPEIGNLEIFIGTQPKSFILDYEFEGDKVYVGTNEM